MLAHELAAAFPKPFNRCVEIDQFAVAGPVMNTP